MNTEDAIIQLRKVVEEVIKAQNELIGAVELLAANVSSLPSAQPSGDVWVRAKVTGATQELTYVRGLPNAQPSDVVKDDAYYKRVYEDCGNGPFHPFRAHENMFGWGINHRETGVSIGFIGEKSCAFGVSAALNNKWEAAQEFLQNSTTIGSDYWERFKVPLSTTQQAQSGEWLPIESAPRDGTPILAYVKYAEGASIFHGRMAVVVPHVEYSGPADPTERILWKEAGGGYYGIKCTHWQPLPKPPFTQNKGD